MKKKILLCIYILIFFALCLAPVIAMISGARNINAEKRTLAALPRLITESGVNLDFPYEFNEYFSDNFGLRTHMVTAYAAFYYRLFNHSVNDKVVPGKEGWLFFSETLPGFKGEKEFSGADLYRLYRILHLQKEFLQKHDIAFIFTVAPDKCSVYGEYVPSRIKGAPDKAVLELVNRYPLMGDAGYVDLLQPLRNSKQENLLYHKKDTHWNNYGAMIAYEEIMRRTAAHLDNFGYENYRDRQPAVRHDWAGDLEVMLLPAAPHRDMQFYWNSEKKYSFDRPPRSLEDMTIITQSDVNGFRLFMIRDSFANALIPFISGNFGYVQYSRALPPDYLKILDVNPDIVVMEIAERNLEQLLFITPLVPAPERSIGQDDNPVYVAGEDIEFKIKPSGDYVKISGLIKPGNIDAEGRKIYIKLPVQDEERYFEAFPVLENDFKGNEGALGFSILLDRRYFGNEEYSFEVVLIN